jgi:hypothetical protein
MPQLESTCRAGETVRVARRSGRRAACDHDALAPRRLEVAVATQVSTGSSADSSGTPDADSQDGQGESAVGRRADRQRTDAQVKHSDLATDGGQVPAEATARSAARGSALVNVPEESRDGDSRVRLLRCREGQLSAYYMDGKGERYLVASLSGPRPKMIRMLPELYEPVLGSDWRSGHDPARL